MIDISFNELNVFTYDEEKLSVGIWQGSDHFRHIGNIKFNDLAQAEQFAEMIGFISDKHEEKEKLQDG